MSNSTNALLASGRSLQRALAMMDGPGALIMVQQVHMGQVDLGAESASAWAVLVDMADEAAASRDEIQLVSWARQQCYGLAEAEEGERWFLRAEQIWHLKNDQRSVRQVQDVGDISVILGEEKRPLWAWGSDTENWPDFCVDALGTKPEQARILERMYDLYVVKMNLPMEEVLRRGKAKQMLALSLMEANWDRGVTDEDLEALLREGTWHEVREYVRGVRNEVSSGTRQPLTCDEQTGKVTYWTDDGLAVEFGVVRLNDPPDDLDPPDKGKWQRRARAIRVTVGLE
jgi:hypothetical protein